MKKLSRIEKDRIEKDTCNLSATQKEIKKFPENHDETAVKNPDFHSRFFFSYACAYSHEIVVKIAAGIVS